MPKRSRAAAAAAAASALPDPSHRPPVPISLGKTSLRIRLEAYYSLISPESVSNVTTWRSRFEKIYSRYGGTSEGERALADKLAKKYGDRVKLLIATNTTSTTTTTRPTTDEGGGGEKRRAEEKSVVGRSARVVGEDGTAGRTRAARSSPLVGSGGGVPVTVPPLGRRRRTSQGRSAAAGSAGGRGKEEGWYDIRPDQIDSGVLRFDSDRFDPIAALASEVRISADITVDGGIAAATTAATTSSATDTSAASSSSSRCTSVRDANPFVDDCEFGLLFPERDPWTGRSVRRRDSHIF